MHIHILYVPIWSINYRIITAERHRCTQSTDTQNTNCCTHTEDSHPRRGVRVQCSLRLHPQFVSINHTVARHGLVRRSTSLCNLLLMCCTLSLSEPIWSDCEQTEIPPMLSEQVLLMGLSIRPSPITACLQSPLNTLHRHSPDFCG